MFLKYRIMKKLKLGEWITPEEISELFPYEPTKKVCEAIDILGRTGFLTHNETLNHVMPNNFASFREYETHLRREFFECAVSISAIIVAITSIIEVFR